MSTCPKCFKPNPQDAAFCGFCGAGMAAQKPSVAAAKTVFGYNFDPSKIQSLAEKTPPSKAKAPIAPAAQSIAPTGQPVAPASRKAAPVPQDPVPQPEASSVRPARTAATTIKKPVESAKTTKTLVNDSPQPHLDPAPASAQKFPLVPPKLVSEQFALGESIAQLPVGELFTGKAITQGHVVDILVVHPTVFQSPLDLERTRRELRQLQKAECTAIVRFLDHGKTDDERLFVVTEHSRGTPLDVLVAQKGPFTIGKTRQVVTGVGLGLAESQKMGVIHRDIAPHNVLIGENGTVKIRGFGVAPPIKRHVFGSPEFISPEQASGRPVDQRSNIYSLGALMFYMLTGRPPFTANTPEEYIAKHQKEEAPSPKAIRPEIELSQQAEELILKALAKSSSRRHLTLRQFLREVESLGDKEKSQTTPASNASFSFETPLHGVTALKGGKEPPPSSIVGTAAEKGAQAVNSKPTGGMDQPLFQMPAKSGPPPTVPLPFSAETAPVPAGSMGASSLKDDGVKNKKESLSALANTMLDTGSQEVVGPPAEETRTSMSAEQKDGDGAATGSKRQSQITGELSSNVALKQPEPPTPELLTKVAEANIKAETANESSNAPAFRETMWFFKGEVESAMAAEGVNETVRHDDVEETPDDLAARYTDDGTLSDEQARRLSLRTGKTQMMKRVNIPNGNLPGDKMKDKDFIADMTRTRRFAIWFGVGVVVVSLGAYIVWLVIS